MAYSSIAYDDCDGSAGSVAGQLMSDGSVYWRAWTGGEDEAEWDGSGNIEGPTSADWGCYADHADLDEGKVSITAIIDRFFLFMRADPDRDDGYNVRIRNGANNCDLYNMDSGTNNFVVGPTTAGIADGSALDFEFSDDGSEFTVIVKDDGVTTATLTHSGTIAHTSGKTGYYSDKYADNFSEWQVFEVDEGGGGGVTAGPLVNSIRLKSLVGGGLVG